MAENIAHHLRHSFRDHPQNWRPLIVCWRGGQRSGAMTLILRRVGWDAQQLEGGYKYYRKLVVDTLAEIPARLAFTILCGATGSGKSRLLQALAQQGEQVLDLEELACHKGSVLGELPDATQPSQKMFETRLLLALAGLDPQRPVYAEAESRKIGSIHLPTALLEAMRRSPCINIEAPLEARVDFLLRDYSYFLAAPAWLNSRLDDLRHLQSKETIERWHEFTRTADWRALVGELLELHYDPLYRRSQNNNFTGLDKPHTFLASDLNPAALAVLAQQIASRSPTPGIKRQTQLVQAPAKA